MRFRVADWSKGLNLDVLPSELTPGFCSNASNVRFRNGFAERVGGVLELGASPAAQPVWMKLYDCDLAPFNVYGVLATATKVYAYDFSGSTTEITRYVEGVAISSITHVGTTAVVNTATAHGLTTGDLVSIWGCTPSQYNVDGTSVSVTDADTFTYAMGSDPGVDASVVGLYSRSSTSNFTSTSDWTGGVLNGILLLNHPVDGLYYWAGDTNYRLRKVPRSYVARVSRVFKNYIVQLAPTIDSVEYPYRLAWGDAAEPGSIPTTFTASPTNDAGDSPLAARGQLVDCAPLGDSNIIYATAGRYAMQYVDGNDVFRFIELPGVDGLFNIGCVADTPAGHVFLNKNYEVMLHSGGVCKNLSQGRVNAKFSIQVSDPHVCTHPTFNEVWFFISTDGGTLNTAMIWNWREDTWGIKTLGSGTFYAATSGILGDYARKHALMVSMDTNKVGLVDESATDLETAFSSYIERRGLDLAEPDVVKNLHRSRWNFDGASGATYTIEHGSAMTADATPTYATGATYTLGTTDYVNARATGGRYLSVKVTWTGTLANPGRVRSCDLDVTFGGVR